MSYNYTPDRGGRGSEICVRKLRHETYIVNRVLAINGEMQAMTSDYS
jgi:hypothetical protein